MIAREYPKIETLYDRLLDFNVDTTKLRCPEFGLISKWLVTEKVDGTNVRIALHADGSIEYGGRTDAAQMPTHLLAYLQATFTADKMRAAFAPKESGPWPEVIIFGEGYGEKIQKKGGLYRKGVAVRVFDVLVGDWWLNWEDVEDVAQKLGIETVPVYLRRWNVAPPYHPLPVTELALAIWAGCGSRVAEEEAGAKGIEPEGIVCRTDPLLFTRRGERVMFKLKFSDFRGGKK